MEAECADQPVVTDTNREFGVSSGAGLVDSTHILISCLKLLWPIRADTGIAFLSEKSVTINRLLLVWRILGSAVNILCLETKLNNRKTQTVGSHWVTWIKVLTVDSSKAFCVLWFHAAGCCASLALSWYQYLYWVCWWVNHHLEIFLYRLLYRKPILSDFIFFFSQITPSIPFPVEF